MNSAVEFAELDARIPPVHRKDVCMTQTDGLTHNYQLRNTEKKDLIDVEQHVEAFWRRARSI